MPNGRRKKGGQVDLPRKRKKQEQCANRFNRISADQVEQWWFHFHVQYPGFNGPYDNYMPCSYLYHLQPHGHHLTLSGHQTATCHHRWHYPYSPMAAEEGNPFNLCFITGNITKCAVDTSSHRLHHLIRVCNIASGEFRRGAEVKSSHLPTIMSTFCAFDRNGPCSTRMNL